MNNIKSALNRFLSTTDYIPKDYYVKHKGIPFLGYGVDKKEFKGYTKGIKDGFSLLGDNASKLVDDTNRNIIPKYLIGGDPLKYPMFPLCKSYMKECIESDNLYEYTSAAGDQETKEEILSYLVQEGFKNEDKLTINNIAFTLGTTQAFDIILKVICKPYDVIIFTAPTYGMFAFMPERNNVQAEYIPLSEEDNWFINPKKLSKYIDRINKKLIKKYANKFDYQPRVVAFFNQNPNNPIGNVMSDKEYKLMKEIGQVCLEKGVFIIDDIIYRDLTFDRKHLALPFGTFSEFFDNTITINGISKCYGIPSMRAGMIVANKYIINAIDNYIFYTMDSLPLIQQRALAGAFNASNERKECYDKYFKKIIPEYTYRLEILKALVNGIDSISDKRKRQKIEAEIINNANKEDNIKDILKGIPNIDFVKGTMAKSGFYSLLDFSKLKGKRYKNYIINSEEDVFNYLYRHERIKVLVGKSLAWPKEDNRFVVRVTFALDIDEIITALIAMGKCIKNLK